MKRTLFWSVFAVILALCGCSCQSTHKVKPESFPQKSIAADVKLLTGDGMEYKLSDIYGDHEGAVVFFWQSKCPCVKRYQDRITELFDRYGQYGVAMLYVSSNTDESFAEAQAEYAKRLSLLPLMRDEGGRLAKLVNAKGTPTAAVFNKAGDLVYLGWVDNERSPQETGRIAYLEKALDDLVAKRDIAVPTSPMFGCPIR